jgi:hypothetical protein
MNYVGVMNRIEYRLMQGRLVTAGREKACVLWPRYEYITCFG